MPVPRPPLARSRLRRLTAPLALAGLVSGALFAPLTECTKFPALGAGACGNGVIDSSESCDTFATLSAPTDSPAGTATACGTTGAGACTYICGTAGKAFLTQPPAAPVCPAGWGCGIDGVCRQQTGHFQPAGNPVPAGAWRVALADFDGDGHADAITRGTIDGRGFSQVRVEYLGSDFTVQDAFVPAPLLGQPQILDMNGDGIVDLTYAYQDLFDIVGVGVLLGNSARKPAQVPYPVVIIPGSGRYYALPFDNGTVNTCAYASAYGPPGSPPALIGLDVSDPEYLGAPITAFTPPTGAKNAAADTLVGGFTLAKVFDQGPAHPCDDVVFAFGNVAANPTVVHVVAPCIAGALGDDAWGTGPAKPNGPGGTITDVTVSLDGNAQYASDPYAPQAMDVDGDGRKDLLIPAVVQETMQLQTFVAYNAYRPDADVDAGPSFAEHADGGGKINVATEVLTSVGGSASPDAGSPSVTAVLATGDINLDGIDDFVTTTGVFLSTPDGSRQGHARSWSAGTGVTQYAWTDAIIGDFNRDGLPDVFAGNRAVPDLDFFAGVAPSGGKGGTAEAGEGEAGPAQAADGGVFGELAHALLTTAGGTGHFSVGDFDGDGTSDFGFAEIDPTGDDTDEVDIVYGVPYEFPGAPVAVGRFSSVVQTLLVPAVGTTPLSLVVVSEQTTGADAGAGDAGDSNKNSSITYFPQTSARPPLSAFILNKTNGKTVVAFGSVEAFVAAPFTQTPLAGTTTLLPDVAALAYAVSSAGVLTGGGNGVTSPWLLASNGAPAQFAPPIHAPTSSSDPTSPLATIEPNGKGGKDFFSLTAAGDLDGDGVPEAVLAAPATCPAPAESFACPTAGVLLIGKYAPDGANSFSYTSVSLTIPISQQGQLAVADVDGDGASDIVLLSGSTEDEGLGSLGQCYPGTGRSLWVLWNQHNGTFAMSDTGASLVAQSNDPCSSPAAFAMLPTTPSGPLSISYVTRASALFVELAAGTRTFMAPSPLPGVATVPDPGYCCSSGYAGNDYAGIAGGDVDGDGLTDFALVNHGDLYLYKGTSPPSYGAADASAGGSP